MEAQSPQNSLDSSGGRQAGAKWFHVLAPPCVPTHLVPEWVSGPLIPLPHVISNSDLDALYESYTHGNFVLVAISTEVRGETFSSKHGT